MSASLVGSEMCIRDRVTCTSEQVSAAGARARCWQGFGEGFTGYWRGPWAVSYTHLTLPTICSV
eukprot:4422780-Alexandrium_andersonii.AAC.1